MRALLRITLSFTVLAWCAMAQHGGGHGGGGGGFHGGGGGFHGSTGGGFRGGGGGGFHGGGGGFHGSTGGGFRGGGGVGSGYRGGYGYGGGGRGYGYGGYGYGRGWGYGGWGYGGYWPYYGWGYPWGFGLSYWPDYYGSYGYYPYNYYDPNTYSDPSYTYSPGPAVTYAPAQGDPYGQSVASGTYAGPAHPVTRSYDEYGQETTPAGGSAANSSPIYLIAQKDGEIQAAGSYWIAGQTLHYVTLDRQEKQVALSSIDRSLTQQLNRERHVSITLPAQ